MPLQQVQGDGKVGASAGDKVTNGSKTGAVREAQALITVVKWEQGTIGGNFEDAAFRKIEGVQNLPRVLFLVQENVAFLKRLRDANPEKTVLRQVNLSHAVLVEETLHNLLEDSFIAIRVRDHDVINEN